MKNFEVFAKAADLLEERGHTKRMLIDNQTGKMCIIGAVNTAHHGHAGHGHAGHDWPTVHLTRELARFVPKVPGIYDDYVVVDCPDCPEVMLASWNNAPERTQQEVVDVLRFASKTLRARELEPVRTRELEPV